MKRIITGTLTFVCLTAVVVAACIQPILVVIGHTGPHPTTHILNLMQLAGQAMPVLYLLFPVALVQCYRYRMRWMEIPDEGSDDTAAAKAN